jgi:type 1 glutamine amidotransferase
MLSLATVLSAADSAPAENQRPLKKVLFFTKSQGFEHDAINTADNPKFGVVFRVLKELGEKNNLEFTFSKDGSLFSTEYLAKFDAFMFYTTGKLTSTGGDNTPPITTAGLEAFYKAIEDGKGFIGVHSATDTFHSPASSWVSDGDAASPYIKLIGGEFSGHGAQQKSKIIVADPKFPGVSAVPADFGPNEEWYSQKNFPADLHVILVQDPAGMNGFQYARQPYPETWARMQGKGRVFYTSMGHRDDVWQSDEFKSILLGGINWTTGRVDADVTPNLDKVTPKANELPVPQARGGREGMPQRGAPAGPGAPSEALPPAAAPVAPPAEKPAGS